MKGVILAAGIGSRFYPATLVTSKQLLPLYDKPLIYYPLAVLMQADLRDIMIIVSETDEPRFAQLLGDGSQLGISIQYRIQPKPLGIPDAFRIAADFIGDGPVALMLGDNLLYGASLPARVAPPPPDGGIAMFAHPVDDPLNYGVFEFAPDGTPLSCTDKPAIAASNFAAVGLYLCAPAVVEVAQGLRSEGGRELSMDDAVRPFFETGKVDVRRLEEGFAWFDTGTPDRLYAATRFVREIEGQLGVKVACIEEVALEQGFIDREALAGLVAKMPESIYSRYLKRLLDGGDQASLTKSAPPATKDAAIASARSARKRSPTSRGPSPKAQR